MLCGRTLLPRPGLPTSTELQYPKKGQPQAKSQTKTRPLQTPNCLFKNIELQRRPYPATSPVSAHRASQWQEGSTLCSQTFPSAFFQVRGQFPSASPTGMHLTLHLIRCQLFFLFFPDRLRMHPALGAFGVQLEAVVAHAVGGRAVPSADANKLRGVNATRNLKDGPFPQLIQTGGGPSNCMAVAIKAQRCT